MKRQCAPAWRRFAMARPMPAWKSHGPGPYAILMWTPLLLIDPILSLPMSSPSWLGWGWLVAIAAADGTAVIAAYRDHSWAPKAVLSLLGAQTILTVTATVWFGADWGALFTLLAVTYGAIGPPKWTPVAVLVLTVGSGLIVYGQGAPWTQTWVTGLTTFLSGMATFGFHRLLTVIAELDATRQALARQAVDRERLRFARDLHDLLGHTLSVIVVKSEAIRRLLPDDTSAASAHAGDIESIGRQSLLEVREAVSGYRDTDLNRELDRAKIALDAAGITLNVESADTWVSAEADTVFGWVVREAITNVIRHANATTCHVTLTADRPHARLTVTDNGHGGDQSGGGGIGGLRERVTTAGGTLTVSPARGGFTLSAEVPLRQHDEASCGQRPRVTA